MSSTFTFFGGALVLAGFLVWFVHQVLTPIMVQIQNVLP